MAHRIYTSEGLVLKKEHVGEKSISALILTSDFGLVRMRAQGARGSEGKLRTSLEPLTFGTFSFVVGRLGARLVGAQAHESLVPQNLHASRHALGNITKLLMRLLPGEEAHADLFETVVKGFRFMKISPEEITHTGECILVLQILRLLGYLPEDSRLKPFVEGSLSEALARDLEAHKPHAVRTINQALSSTGL